MEQLKDAPSSNERQLRSRATGGLRPHPPLIRKSNLGLDKSKSSIQPLRFSSKGLGAKPKVSPLSVPQALTTIIEVIAPATMEVGQSIVPVTDTLVTVVDPVSAHDSDICIEKSIICESNTVADKPNAVLDSDICLVTNIGQSSIKNTEIQTSSEVSETIVGRESEVKSLGVISNSNDNSNAIKEPKSLLGPKVDRPESNDGREASKPRKPNKTKHKKAKRNLDCNLKPEGVVSSSASSSNVGAKSKPCSVSKVNRPELNDGRAASKNRKPNKTKESKANVHCKLYNDIVQNFEQLLVKDVFGNEALTKGSIKGIRQSFNLIKSSFAKLTKENETLWCMLDSNRNHKAPVPEVSRSNTKLTYANTVKLGLDAVTKNPIQATKPRDVSKGVKTLIIKPKVGTTTLNYPKQGSLLSDVIKAIKPRENRLKISNIRVQPNSGKIVLECADKATFNKVSSNDRLKSETLISEPKKWNPRVKIVGVDSSMTADSLMDALQRQNLNSEEHPENQAKPGTTGKANGTRAQAKGARPLFKCGPKNHDTCNWVLRVTPKIRKELINNRYVYIDHKRCRVYDYFEPIRCQNCQKFGHVKARCRNKQETCPHCSKGHALGQCKNLKSLPQCSNCKGAKSYVCTNHTASSRDCPIYKSELNSYIENTVKSFSV